LGNRIGSRSNSPRPEGNRLDSFESGGCLSLAHYMDSQGLERNPILSRTPEEPPAVRRSPWILGARPRPQARQRLFCLPYAGGAASGYRSWADLLPADVEVCPVQLPGRGSRFREAPFRRVADLVAALAEGLLPLLDLPFALFGHSMGALVAFELARELRRRGAHAPSLLALSGHQAPRRPAPEPPFSHLPDAEFLAEVRRRYDGIPPEVLAEEELLRLLLPVLRADIEVLESYAYAPEGPLDCPVSCFGGENDPHVSLADLQAWRDETSGPLRVRTFAGGHFFVESARDEVLRCLSLDLLPSSPSEAGPA
jgi:medium-chain acyl-[acyl-carrier-protein] hydrolase